MSSINWIASPAPGMLMLFFFGSAAWAQENASAIERSLSDARAENPRQDQALYMISGGDQLPNSAKVSWIDWGTGDIALWDEPQFKLHVGRGRTTAKSRTSADISRTVGL